MKEVEPNRIYNAITMQFEYAIDYANAIRLKLFLSQVFG